MSKITETVNNLQREKIRIEAVLEEDTDEVFKLLKAFFYKVIIFKMFKYSSIQKTINTLSKCSEDKKYVYIFF